MVELNYVSKNEIDSFNDGANARFTIIYETIISTIENQTKLGLAENLYENSIGHATISKLSDILKKNASEYNKSELSDAIEEIISLDPQIYYDLIVIAHAMLQVKDISLKKEFIDSIDFIASSDENIDDGEEDNSEVSESNSEVEDTVESSYEEKNESEE